MKRVSSVSVSALLAATILLTATGKFSGTSFHWYDYCWIGPLFPVK